MTFFDCTADLVGQLNGNGQKGMLQIDAPPVENFWLRHCYPPRPQQQTRRTLLELANGTDRQRDGQTDSANNSLRSQDASLLTATVDILRISHSPQTLSH